MKNTLLLSLFLVFTFLGCTKEGAMGPDGKNGIDGADGSTIFSGNGLPEISMGKKGDYYLDLGSFQLYGPKNSNWGAGVGLRGKDGVDGKEGAAILNGNGQPSLNLGKAGDFYLDRESFLLYGPKETNTWGGGLLLKGNDGNANVRTYIFTNPYTSLNPLNGTNNFTFSLFPPIADSDVNTGLVLIYVQAKMYTNTGSEDTQQGINYLWSLLGSGSKLMSAYDLELKYSIPSIATASPFVLIEGNVLGNYSINTVNELKYYSGISAFKIVVVPSSTVTYMSVKHGIDKNDIKSISEFIQN